MIKNYLEDMKTEIRQAFNIAQNHIRLEDVFKNSSQKDVIIYGAGNVGKYVCDILLRNNLSPMFFLDAKGKQLGSYAGIPIYSMRDITLSEQEKASMTVILCVISDYATITSITENLNTAGFQNVVIYQQKAFSDDCILRSKPSYSEAAVYDYADEILSCLELFIDERSCIAYKNHMIAFCSRSFENLEYITDEPQYFPKDILFSKGYSTFIDCGAFNGDTIEQLLINKDIPEAIFAFEPDPMNFKSLSNRLDHFTINQACLFPCGVSSKTETLRFKFDSVYSGLASTIDSHGEHLIQCVALDDILKGVKPTFIKMDIEGAEYDALIGAKNIISKYKPDLAISVYHYFNHYFEIPHLINSWNLGYQFYLRTYDKNANETVLYAIAREY